MTAKPMWMVRAGEGAYLVEEFRAGSDSESRQLVSLRKLYWPA